MWAPPELFQMLLMKRWAALNYRSMLNWLAQRGEAAVAARKQGDTFVSDWPGRTIHHVEDCRVYCWFVSQSHQLLPCRAGQRPASHTTHPLHLNKVPRFAFVLITFQSSQLTSHAHNWAHLISNVKKKVIFISFFVTIFKLDFTPAFSVKTTLRCKVPVHLINLEP